MLQILAFRADLFVIKNNCCCFSLHKLMLFDSKLSFYFFSSPVLAKTQH